MRGLRGSMGLERFELFSSSTYILKSLQVELSYFLVKNFQMSIFGKFNSFIDLTLAKKVTN